MSFGVRDSKIEGIEMKKDELMGVGEEKIVRSDVNEFDGVKGVVRKVVNEDREILRMI
ncbi:hypothetical protein [Staphylococcus epidermidis]|uniref:hypothetical protein n=1 Tax=Staphylococcus epidermidis TaxID=1282 RepID=UPI0037D9ECAE